MSPNRSAGLPALLSLLPPLFLCVGCTTPSPEPDATRDPLPTRIVSTAPSITEILYALDLGDRVVGVSSFCDHPPEAKEKTSIGGFLDPNLEVLVGLKPDLVILLDSAGPLRDGVERLGIEHLMVKNRTVDDILESFRLIGSRCGVEDKAETLIAKLNVRIAAVARRPKKAVPPSVLFVVSRPGDSGDIRDVYVAANDGYFSRLIELAGGKNACPAGPETFPVVSVEGLLQMDPDIIIDTSFTPAATEGGTSGPSVEDWNSLPTLTAVQTGRIHPLTASSARIPGPRFVELLEKLAELINR